LIPFQQALLSPPKLSQEIVSLILLEMAPGKLFLSALSRVPDLQFPPSVFILPPRTCPRWHRKRGLPPFRTSKDITDFLCCSDFFSLAINFLGYNGEEKVSRGPCSLADLVFETISSLYEYLTVGWPLTSSPRPLCPDRRGVVGPARLPAVRKSGRKPSNPFSASTSFLPIRSR